MHPTNSLTMLLLMHTCYLEGMAGGRIKRSRAYQTYLHPKRCQRDVTFELTISQGTPTKTCEPGLRYCGHELTRYGNVVLEALYSCSSDGVSMVGLATCAKCKAQGRSYCHCTPYANYCGHQLIDSYYWNNVLRDTSYVCDSSGMSATELKSCAHGCSGDGICIAGTCTSGAYYCGHELVKDDWSTMKYKLLPNERWKCSSDGKSAEYENTCSSLCIVDPLHSSLCSKSCTAGQLYCGWELKAKDYTLTSSQGLYTCDSDDTGVTLITSCTTSCGKASPSRCNGADCTIGVSYCGHQLIEMYWNETITKKETLYKCTAATSASGVRTCTKCKAYGDHSYCHCNPGTNYCGHELLDKFSWPSPDSSTSYECSSDGTLAVGKKVCTHGCDYGDTCKRQNCRSGAIYCGHELVAMDWPAIFYSAQARYKCLEDGVSAAHDKTCSSSCIGEKSKASRCSTDCTAGALYCGWELEAKDYTVSSSQALYQCDSDGAGVTLTTSCTTSCERASPSRCKSAECSVGSSYCGHQLVEMYWTPSTLERETLYNCTSAITANYLAACTECRKYGTQSYCHCVPGAKYCGHELTTKFHWPDAISDNSYECNPSGTLADKPKVCKYGCDQGDTCKRRYCLSGFHYCGVELLALDWPGSSYSANMQYLCSSDTFTATYVKTCASSCIDTVCTKSCIAEQLYCGWELEAKDYAVSFSQALYKCDSNGSAVTLTKHCTTTCEKASPSQCKSANCSIGSLYCGHQFTEMYWTTPLSTLERLYNCTGAKEVDLLTGCTKCRASEQQSYCHCVPGSQYCGHELTSKFHWPGAVSDSSYECDYSGMFAINPKQCTYGCDYGGSCKRGACVSNLFYCGHQLVARNWPASTYSAHAWYKCSADGLTAEYTRTCHSLCEDWNGCLKSCTAGSVYCGSELEELDFEMPSNQSNYLYRCNSAGSGITTENACNGTCDKGSPSRCRRLNCQAGGRYCGRELLSLNWQTGSTDADALYKCDSDETSATLLTTCPGCLGAAPASKCPCVAAKNYCGDYLNDTLRWTKVDRGIIYTCDATERTATASKVCNKGCSSVQLQPTCSMEPCLNHGSLYCGNELIAKDWPEDIYKSATLYRCSDNGLSATKEKDCMITCSAVGVSHCETKCNNGSYYCGHELTGSGHGFDIPLASLSNLYKCGSDGTSASVVEICSSTCVASKKSHCEPELCQPGGHYCGSELVAMNWPAVSTRPNVLHECEKRGNTSSALVSCGDCIRRGPKSMCGCVPLTKYCGTELQDKLFWTLEAAQLINIHECQLGGSSVMSNTTVCATGCFTTSTGPQCNRSLTEPPVSETTMQPIARTALITKRATIPCISGKYQCGHELHDKFWSHQIYEAQALYKCGDDTVTATLQRSCPKQCVATAASHCDTDCSPTKLYCGYELEQIGWQNLSRRSLYRCDDLNSMEMITHCVAGCIVLTSGSQCDTAIELESAMGDLKSIALFPPTTTPASSTIATTLMTTSSPLPSTVSLSPSRERTSSITTSSRPTTPPPGTIPSLAVTDVSWFAPSSALSTTVRSLGTTASPLQWTSMGASTVANIFSPTRNFTAASVPIDSTVGGTKADLTNPTFYMPAFAPGASVMPTDNPSSKEMDTTTRLPPLNDEPTCGVSWNDRYKWQIRDGENARYGQWPWMVSLSNKNGDHFCGGVILSNRWVLTAAHCLVEKNLKTIYVGKFSTGATDKYEEPYEPKRVIIYDAFERTKENMNNDIGLIELAESITFSAYAIPICLPAKGEVPLSPGKRCLAIGWGGTDGDNAMASILQMGAMKILPGTDCQTSGQALVRFNNQTMICAGGKGKKSVASVCPGDSGGPLMCQAVDSPTAPWTVHGIVSWKKADPRTPKGLCAPKVNTFAFAKVAGFTSWISDTMATSVEDGIARPMKTQS